MLKLGTSALFMMLEKVTPDKAVEAMSQYGGTVLKTSLSKEDERNSRTPCTAARLLRSSRHQPVSQLTRTRRCIQRVPGQRFASGLPLTGPVREVPEHG